MIWNHAQYTHRLCSDLIRMHSISALAQHLYHMYANSKFSIGSLFQRLPAYALLVHQIRMQVLIQEDGHYHTRHTTHSRSIGRASPTVVDNDTTSWKELTMSRAIHKNHLKTEVKTTEVSQGSNKNNIFFMAEIRPSSVDTVVAFFKGFHIFMVHWCMISEASKV